MAINLKEHWFCDKCGHIVLRLKAFLKKYICSKCQKGTMRLMAPWPKIGWVEKDV